MLCLKTTYLKHIMSLNWQDVDEDGLLKRYPIPGGYVYAAFDWMPDPDLRAGGHWRMVNAFFVPTATSAADRVSTRWQDNFPVLIK
jgi:hypothetical protein